MTQDQIDQQKERIRIETEKLEAMEAEWEQDKPLSEQWWTHDNRQDGRYDIYNHYSRGESPHLAVVYTVEMRDITLAIPKLVKAAKAISADCVADLNGTVTQRVNASNVSDLRDALKRMQVDE